MKNRETADSLSPGPERLVSLDAFRGFTMLAMVSAGLGTAHLMNHPTWGCVADQLEHRDWIGCTAWDLIQPAFMFIVGVAMPFSFAQRRQRGESWGWQFLHVLKRAALLIAIGVFLDCFGSGKIVVQFIRVLQQIAIGYVLAFLVLHRGPIVQAMTAAIILVAHAAAYILYAQDGGCWPWEQGYNLGTHLDWVLGLPLSTGGYATLNALSSTATILFGVLAGELLRGPLPPLKKVLILYVAGVGGILAGLLLSPVVPLVKRIWTSSFALYAGGWTCLMLATFYGIIDGLKFRRWTLPLVVVGMNSIAMYVISQMFKPVIRQGLRPFLPPIHWAFEKTGVYSPSDVPLVTPVLLAVLVMVVEWGVCYWLYRRRIFFKV
jgi:predicted acyltransferase